MVAKIDLEVCDKCRYLCRMTDEKKKNPTGVRMNDEKLKFVMEKEGLTSRQKVVNFLLDRYWWEQKIGSVPTLDRQVQIQNLNETTNEVKPPEPPKEPYAINTKVKGKIKELEAELPTLGAGTFAAQRRRFIQTELSTLRRLLNQ